MTDNELLLAISNMMDTKLEPIKADVEIIKKVVADHSEQLKQLA